MKEPTWFIFSLLTIIFLTPWHTFSMQNTFWGPSIRIDKPRFIRDDLTTFELSGYYHKTDTSYNCNGRKVPLLDFAGPEPLLERFVDSSLPNTDSTLAGYGVIGGNYHGKGAMFTWQQNIHENLYLEMTSAITNDTISNVSIIPTTKDGRCLTAQEISDSQALINYLEQLDSILFTSASNPSQNRTYIGRSCFLMGYTTSINDFQHLDFVDIAVQTGFMVPIIPIAHSWKTLSIFPHQDEVSLGIPLQLNIAVGLYDWLNIGASGMIMGYVKNDQIVAMNSTKTPNKILIPTQGLCSVATEPMIAMSAYVEGEYFLPRLNWFVGLSYTKQYKTTYQAYDQQTFPTKTINKFPRNNGWEYAYLTVTSELDLTKTQESQLMPRCKFIYVVPVYGVSSFATQTFAGQLGMEIVYDF